MGIICLCFHEGERGREREWRILIGRHWTWRSTNSPALPALPVLLQTRCAALRLARENGYRRRVRRRAEERAHMCDLFGLLQGPRHTEMRPQFLPLLHLYALGRKWRWLRLPVPSVPNGNVWSLPPEPVYSLAFIPKNVGCECDGMSPVVCMRSRRS